MIRPEVSEGNVNEIKMLSENANLSFDNALTIVIEKYKKLLRSKKPQ